MLSHVEWNIEISDFMISNASKTTRNITTLGPATRTRFRRSPVVPPKVSATSNSATHLTEYCYVFKSITISKDQ